MPKFIPFHHIQNRTILHVHENYFRMRPARVRKRSDNQATFSIPHLVQHPFRMVKSITVRSGNCLDETPCAVRNQQTFVSPITFANKLGPCLSAKIKERHAFCTIVSKRHVTSLFTIIPHRIATIRKRSARFCDSRPQQTSSGHSKRIVIRNTTVVRAIEQLFGNSKATLAILHLPCTLGLER